MTDHVPAPDTTDLDFFDGMTSSGESPETEAERLLAAAVAEAHRITTEARATADALIAEERERYRTEASEVVAAAIADARGLVTNAQAQVDELLATGRREREALIEQAQRDADELLADTERKNEAMRAHGRQMLDAIEELKAAAESGTEAVAAVIAEHARRELLQELRASGRLRDHVDTGHAPHDDGEPEAALPSSSEEPGNRVVDAGVDDLGEPAPIASAVRSEPDPLIVAAQAAASDIKRQIADRFPQPAQ